MELLVAKNQLSVIVYSLQSPQNPCHVQLCTVQYNLYWIGSAGDRTVDPSRSCRPCVLALIQTLVRRRTGKELVELATSTTSSIFGCFCGVVMRSRSSTSTLQYSKDSTYGKAEPPRSQRRGKKQGHIPTHNIKTKTNSTKERDYPTTY